MKSDDKVGIGCGLAVLVLALLWGIVSFNINQPRQEGHYTVTVRDKQAVVDDKTYKYLIFTDKGVFQDVDSITDGKFNSSDVFNALQVGHTYTLDTRGRRVPVLSHYPNIVHYQEVMAQHR